MAIGVVLGLVLGLFAPLALMSLHSGGLFGGFVDIDVFGRSVDLHAVVLAELMVPLVAWLVVGVALVTRRPRRRTGIGVLIGGALPALLLMALFLPPLVAGFLSYR